MGCLSVEVEPRNSGVTVVAELRNVKLEITVALVCYVGMGDYEYFYVKEGPLEVSEGYFLVKRQET